MIKDRDNWRRFTASPCGPCRVSTVDHGNKDEKEVIRMSGETDLP